MTASQYFKHEITHLDDANKTTIETVYRRSLHLPDEVYYSKVNGNQPGTGKSTDVITKINDTNINSKILIIVPTHELAEDIKEKVDKKKQFVILKGFKRACKKYDADIEIKQLYENKVPSLSICSYKKCKGACHYRNQYKEYKKAGVSVCMPVQLLHVIDLSIFHEIYVDERIESGFESKWDSEYIVNEIRKVKSDDIIRTGFLSKIIAGVINKDVNVLKRYEKTFTRMTQKHNQKTGKESKTSLHLINTACRVRLSSLIMHLEFSKETGNELNFLLVPIHYQHFLFYKQLKAEYRKINYLCASFPKDLFLSQLKKFEEKFPDYKGHVTIYSTNKTNKNTVIYKHGNNGFYKGRIEKEIEWAKSEIKKLIKREKYNKGKKVCILTYKKLVIKNKFLGCNAFWFGASHGINYFRDYDILIVLGTYMPSSEMYLKYYIDNHENGWLPDLDSFETGKGTLKPSDLKMRKLYEDKIEGDVYDSVHRIRPLETKDGRKAEIHWHGNNIPQKLYKEFTVVDV